MNESVMETDDMFEESANDDNASVGDRQLTVLTSDTNDNNQVEVSEDVIIVESDTETLSENTRDNVAVSEAADTNHVNDNDLNTTSDDFVEGTVTSSKSTKSYKPEGAVPKKTKSKKRKAAESLESTDSEEGSVCTICFEDWSNSGEHRISSLKCGHFFGFSCIDKWLRGSGNACPNCNEKNTKKDIRVHFVAKLAAIDTSERDRAINDLETTKTQLREIQLQYTELSVRCKLQAETIHKLEMDNR